MSKQLLIYEKTVPVTTERHGDWSIKAGADYAFAKGINAVPLTAVEFASAASEYPIVFTGQDDRIMPAVVLGMRDGENLYLTDDDKWDARYVPAFIRRYPFVFSSSEDGKTFTLCVDESFPGFNQDGRGERLFDAEGQQTQYLKGVLSFLQDYQAQFQRTQAFCKRLAELELLEPMQAAFTLPSGERASLAGFMGIEREKLKALDGDTLAQLAMTDQLELAYLQLHSLRNLSAMANRAKGDVRLAEAGAGGKEEAKGADSDDKKKTTKKKATKKKASSKKASTSGSD